MEPKVVSVKETSGIDARGNISKVLQITYFVGTHGPFTLVATQEELRNGTVNTKLNEMVAALQQLPLGSLAAGM